MAGLPDETRPEPIDLLAGLMADQRDRTERGAVLGARDDIDQAMTANYRLTGDAMSCNHRCPCTSDDECPHDCPCEGTL